MVIKSRRLMFCKMNKMCRWALLRFLNIYQPTNQLRINVIQFWASNASMISIIKWQCHSCCCCHYYCYYFIIIVIIIFIIIIFIMRRFNEYARFTWSSCHAGVVQLLLETCAQILTILSTSSKHVLVGMTFLGLDIGGMSHQSCKAYSTYRNQQHCWWFH